MPPRIRPSSPPASRQTRLDLGEAEAELADRYANYRVLRKAFLSATALSSHAHCNVKPFIERVLAALGLDHETWQMRAGVRAHEEVQGALEAAAAPSGLTLAEALEEGAFAFAAEYALRDERRMLRGIADLVFAHERNLYIIELKNARPPAAEEPRWGAPVWFEHGLQLQFYAVLARTELARAPRLALAYLRGQPRSAVLDPLAERGDAQGALLDLYHASARLQATPVATAEVNRRVRAFRREERASALPQPDHADPGRCAGCRVRAWCPRRLDRPGAFEPLDARLLDAAP